MFMQVTRQSAKVWLAIVASLTLGSHTNAHFPWLAIDGENRAIHFFGESIAQRDYKLPEKIATAEVHSVGIDGTEHQIAMENIEASGFIGRVSSAPVDPVQRIQSNVTYGIYGGSRLDYYTSHIPGKISKSFDVYATQPSTSLFLCFAIDTPTGVTVRVLWDRKPLADTEVRLFSEKGDERAMQKTGASGEVQFTDAQVEAGLNGVLVGFVQKDEEGQIGDRKYKSASHYLTMTFRDPEELGSAIKIDEAVGRSDLESNSKPVASATREETNGPKPYADLPLPLTSFGAVRHGSKLFVYGGHTGEAHHYSTQEQSDSLFAIDLEEPDAVWKELSKGRRLQGLGLVAYGDSVIRVGGFEAVNGVDEEHDLRSSSEVMAFNLKTQTWTNLPELPEPRSSHDALVVGDRLYVIGGWTLRGTETEWLSTAWSIPLPAEGKNWEALPSPNFVRRAIALAATQHRIYAIGGMNEKGGPTTEVAFYDIASGEWKSAPALQGKPMNGFGAAAWNQGDTIIATTSEGDIQKLTSDATDWEIVGKTHDARFFHRLLPYRNGKFVALGGANMQQHLKFPNLEIISVP